MSSLRFVTSLLVALSIVPGTVSADDKRTSPKSAATDSILQRPAFSASPAELQSLRGKPPAGLDIEMLLDDTVLRYDAQGRAVSEYHMIYRVLTDKGAEDWGGVGASYRPWYQDRAAIRARVITKEGATFELDAKTLVDASAAQSGDNVYSDRRRVSGPLPAVRAGAIVESQIVVRDHKAMFAGGTVNRVFLSAVTYSVLTRVSVEAPVGFPLVIKRHGALPAPVVTKAGNTQVTSFSAADLLPLGQWPEALDPASTPEPFIDVSTAKNWNAVAAEYARSVDAELTKFDAKPLVDGVLAGEVQPEAKLSKLLAYLHAQVRYTGLELGERSILPNPPADTLARHYGDCKDKSTLLVGLLRAAGFDANVALLRSGSGMDVMADAAGLGLFDHAIVHVAGKTPLWIDPTDPYARVGTLPYGDQDRLALIASGKTQALVRTPRVSEEFAVYEEEIEVEFPQLGRAAVRETSRGTGPIDSEVRGAFDHDEAQLTENHKEYVKQRFAATITRALGIGTASDLTKPFEFLIEGKDAENFETHDDGGLVAVAATRLYQRLPDALYETPDSQISEKEAKEKLAAKDPRFREASPSDVYLARPHRHIIRYRLKAPLGFAWDTLPDPLTLEAAGIAVSRAVSHPTERDVVVTFEIRSKARSVPLAKLQAVREVLHAFDQQSGATLRFVHQARVALDAHKVVEALRVHRELLAALPNEVSVTARYAHDLVRVGFASAARKAVDGLVKAHPKVPRAHWSRGYVYLFDLVGRDTGPSANFDEAEKSFRAALKLDPEDPIYYQALGTVLNRQAARAYPFDQARLVEVGALFEKLRTKFDHHDQDLTLLRNYVQRGAFQEAVKLAEELGPSDTRNGAWVAALAALQNGSAAQRKAEQLSGGQPAQTLGFGLGLLVIMGHYGPARAIAELPIVKKEQGALLGMLEGTARKEQCLAQLSPPARAAYDWLKPYLIDADHFDDPGLKLEKLPRASVDAYGLEKGLDALKERTAMFGPNGSFLATRFVADAIPCYLRWEAEERAGAVRVKLLPPGESARSEEVDTFYLRRSKSGYEMVGMRGKGRTIPFSRAMQLALAQNKLDEARVWLEWANGAIAPFGGFKTKANFYDMLKALWPSKPEAATPDELKLAAAALSGSYGVYPRDSAILEAALKRPQNTPDQLRALRFVLGLVKQFSDPKLAAEITKPLFEEFPEDKELAKRYFGMLDDSHQDAVLTSALDSYGSRYPDDHAATQHYRNELGRRAGRYASVLDDTLARMAKNQVDQSELNNVAWFALYTPSDMEKVLRIAKAACEPLDKASASCLHTLATVYAESKDADNSFRHLNGLLQRAPRKVPPSYYYTLGRLAELLSLPEVAAEALGRVEKPEFPDDSSTYVLAQRALGRPSTAATARGSVPR